MGCCSFHFNSLFLLLLAIFHQISPLIIIIITGNSVTDPLTFIQTWNVYYTMMHLTLNKYSWEYSKNPCYQLVMHFRNIYVFVIYDAYSHSYLTSCLSSVFHSTPSTCSQGLRLSWLLTLCVDPVGTQFFAFLGRQQTQTCGVKRCTPSTLGSTPADLHFHMFLPQLVRVFCIFYAGFFTGPSYRPQETRGDCYVLLPPPLPYWVPSYMLNYSKCLEYPAVHSQNSPVTLQGTAGTPPQMSLVTPELSVKPWVIYSGEHC